MSAMAFNNSCESAWGYDVTVPFWCSTILRYVIATLVSAFVSILVVFCLLAFVVAPKDDSPALGIAWFMFSVLLACVLIPLGLGVTGEMIERGVQGRRFRGLGAFIRSLLAIPIMVGPIYCLYEVFLLRPDARDSLWAVKLTVLSLLSAFFAVRALRIRGVPVSRTGFFRQG
jgi:hypothetical protein